jgi:hypothetical protein
VPHDWARVVMARVSELVDEVPDGTRDALRWAKVLSHRECRHVSLIGNPTRRAEWLAGRLLAKFVCSISVPWTERRDASAPTLDLVTGREVWRRARRGFACIEIVPPEPGERGGLQIRGLDRERDGSKIALSLSHAAGWVAVAVSVEGPVGVDIEAVTPRSDAFARDVFLEAERTWIGRDLDVHPRATLLWTLKESAYKSSACDETFAPRCTEVHWLDPDAEPPPLVALSGVSGPMSSLRLRLQRAGAELAQRAAAVRTAEWIVSVVGRPQER